MNDKFLGFEVSNCGKKHRKVDYATLAKTFNCVLANMFAMEEQAYLELINGNQIDEEDNYTEILQFYIIDKKGKDILKKYTDEIVFYDEKLDVYLWGITHYGTSWDYVLTDIDLE